MPTTTEDETSLHPQHVAPFEGDVSPVMFGVEHEYSETRQRIALGADQANHYGTDYPVYEMPDGWVGHSEHCGWEVKTPPSTNVAEVMAVFRRMEEDFRHGGHNNCGLHVHINCDPLMGGAAEPQALAADYMAHRPYLRTIVPNGSRVGNSEGRYYAGAVDSADPFAAGTSKYTEVNTSSLYHHGTIEFRLATGTCNMDAFETWLRTLLGLAARHVYDTDQLTELIRCERRPNIDPRLGHNYTTGDPNRHGSFMLNRAGQHGAAAIQSLLLASYTRDRAEVTA